LISSIAPEAEASQEQLQALAAYADAIVKTLDAGYSAGRLSEAGTSFARENLNWYVGAMFLHQISLIFAQFIG
jgi:hypothetical protein